MNSSCRGPARPLISEPLLFSQRSTTSSLNRGMLPTRLASVRPLLLPSPSLIALKRRARRSCLHWMSQWPCISAHPLQSDWRLRSPTPPSHVGPLPPSLDVPTPWLDSRPRCFTLWPYSRSFRPNSSTGWVRTWPRGFQGAVQCARPGTTSHKDHSAGHRQVNGQSSGAGAPLMAKPDWDQGGRQGSLPRLSGLPHRDFRTCRRGLCWTLHRHAEVIPGDATLIAQVLHLCNCVQSPQACAISAASETCTFAHSACPKSWASTALLLCQLPKCQGPRPKLMLNHAPLALSWSTGQEE